MAGPARDQDPDLIDLGADLFARPWAYDFHAAVRLLARLQPDREPVGRGGPPGEEIVHFEGVPDLGFPDTDIRSLREADERPPRLVSGFLGLVGPQGTLPSADTVLVSRRLARRDSALADFLDLFHHRLVSLFHRAWERHRLEQVGIEQSDSPTTRHLLALAGLMAGSSAAEQSETEALFAYAGLFAGRVRSAAGLTQMLGRIFGDPITVEPCVGRWFPLAESDVTRIGPGGSSRLLGLSATVGDRAWEASGGFRLRIGPVPYARFLEWMPESPRFASLLRLTRRFVGIEFDFDVQVVVDASEVPESRLSHPDDPTSRLGRTARVTHPDARPGPGEAEFAPIFSVDTPFASG